MDSSLVLSDGFTKPFTGGEFKGWARKMLNDTVRNDDDDDLGCNKCAHELNDLENEMGSAT